MLFAVAAWIRWQSGLDDNEEPYLVDDPLAAQTRSIVDASAGDYRKMAASMLAFEPVFGIDFASDAKALTAIASYLENLFELGAVKSTKLFIG